MFSVKVLFLGLVFNLIIATLLQVREGLVPLIAAIREKGTPPDTSVLEGTFDTDAQAALCNAIAKELGFNLECGRLDVSVHPFTGGARSLSPGCPWKVR